MTDLDRRSALAMGFVGLSGLILPGQAAAQTYGPHEGKELTQGVRQIDLGDMADTITDAGKRVGAHVRKVLANLKTVDRQRAHEGPIPNG